MLIFYQQYTRVDLIVNAPHSKTMTTWYVALNHTGSEVTLIAILETLSSVLNQGPCP